MVGFGVFADNRFRLFRELAGHLLAGFVAGIVDSFLVRVAVTTQGCDVFEIDACREVGKQEKVPCEIRIGRTVGGYLRLRQPLHLLLADGTFAGSRPQPSLFGQPSFSFLLLHSNIHGLRIYPNRPIFCGCHGRKAGIKGWCCSCRLCPCGVLL